MMLFRWRALYQKPASPPNLFDRWQAQKSSGKIGAIGDCKKAASGKLIFLNFN